MNFGRYQVVRELGKGAMGVVYLAHDPNIDRSVALKVLREDRITGEGFVKRFLKEARAVGRLSHPNIVTVYDIGEDGGTIYIAMEYLEGRPLNEIIQKKEYTPKQVLQLGIQVADALHYAHQKGIIHRDIKPSNIIVQPDGLVKITDFGIARIEDASATMQTQTGEILGTPAYMSPEQILGSGVDGRSDLFSLGIVLYEMSTGERPFGRQGKNIATLFNDIVNVEPPEPSKTSPDVDRTLSRVTMKCLRKTVDKRFSTGKALADALRNREREIELATLAVTPPGKNWKKQPFLLLVPLVFAAVIAAIFLLPRKEAAVKAGDAQPMAEVGMKTAFGGSSPNVSSRPPEVIPASVGVSDNIESGTSTEKPVQPALSTLSMLSTTNRPVEETGSKVEDIGKEDAGLNVQGGVPGEVAVKAKETGEEQVALLKPSDVLASGILVVESVPHGARLFLDSKPIGTTPQKKEGLSGGTHVVSLKLEGYRDWSQDIRIAPGEKTSVQATLKKIATDTGSSKQSGTHTPRVEPTSPPTAPTRPQQRPKPASTSPPPPTQQPSQQARKGGPASAERCGDIVLKASQGLQLSADDRAFYKSNCK